jgi:hypothetical protein
MKLYQKKVQRAMFLARERKDVEGAGGGGGQVVGGWSLGVIFG